MNRERLIEVCLTALTNRTQRRADHRAEAVLDALLRELDAQDLTIGSKYAAAPNFCHSCGADIRKFEVMEADGFVMAPTGLMTYQGRVVHLSPNQNILLKTLLIARPHFVSIEVLLNRMGSDGSNNTAYVQITGIRRRLAQQGIPCPIQGSRGRGVRWAMGDE